MKKTLWQKRYLLRHSVRMTLREYTQLIIGDPRDSSSSFKSNKHDWKGRARKKSLGVEERIRTQRPLHMFATPALRPPDQWAGYGDSIAYIIYIVKVAAHIKPLGYTINAYVSFPFMSILVSAFYILHEKSLFVKEAFRQTILRCVLYGSKRTWLLYPLNTYEGKIVFNGARCSPVELH